MRTGSFLALTATLVGACLAGCGVTLRVGDTAPASHHLEVRERAARRCIHGAPGRDSPYRVAVEVPGMDAALAAHLERFPDDVRRTAVAAGVDSILAALLEARAAHRAAGAPVPTELLAMRDELSARMFALETQLLAMEFEVDCVRGLLLETLSDYEESETDRQLGLTIASLAVGAGTGIAAGFWDLSASHRDSPRAPNGPLIVGLVGATGTAALGAPVLVRRPRAILFLHEHNVLSPIATGDDPDFIYPTFVYRLLTLPRRDGTPTPREDLLATWRELLDDAVDADERALAESIVLGEGGIYDPELLDVHQQMLQELGAELDSLARDIDLLSTAITIVLGEESLREAEPRAIVGERD